MADFDVKVIELARVKEAECYTKKIECLKYWDSHGKRIDYGKNLVSFEQPKKIELFRVVHKYMFEYVPAQTFESFELHVDGVECDCALGITGEITYFKALKTKVKLELCIGAG